MDNQKNKWKHRTRHPKCKYCKHLKKMLRYCGTQSFETMECKAKKRDIADENIIRFMCDCYEVKGELSQYDNMTPYREYQYFSQSTVTMYILSDICRNHGINGSDMLQHITIQENNGFANFFVDGKLEVQFRVKHINNGTVSSVRFIPTPF